MMAAATVLRALEAVTGLFDVAQKFREGPQKEPATRMTRAEAAIQPVPGTGTLEARLAGVVVAALKEAFDRDRTRLDLERTQIEAERRRVEESLRLELRRQAADRAFLQIRLLVLVSLAIWLVSAVLSAFMPGMRVAAPKVLLAMGWVALVGTMACGLAGYNRLSRWMDGSSRDPEAPTGGALVLLPWLLLAGLALTAASLLFAL